VGVTTASHPRGRRHLPKQQRINFGGARSPRTGEIDEALADVRRSGVVPILSARLHRRADAERRLSLLGFHVALTLHGWTKGHQMHLVDVVRLINALKPETLRLLQMAEWQYAGSYDRFQRLHTRIASALQQGWMHVDRLTGESSQIDLNWYRGRVVGAPVPPDLVRGCALAIDGTGMETWGRLHGDRSTVDPDGEPDIDVDDEQ
jgi:hypothetical protein